MTNAQVAWFTGIVGAFAVIVAPLITLWIQRRLEEVKAKMNRRQEIFRTLWINRRRLFYVARVDALNMIDVEFYGERAVIDAWGALRVDYFRNEHPGLTEAQIGVQREEMFATLLYEISRVLGYQFSRTNIRDNIYRPQLHNDFDVIEFETRKRVRDLLRSDALPVRFVADRPAAAADVGANRVDAGE